MPLKRDKSDASFKTNVRTLMGEVGKSPHVQSRSQALAVAYAVKRRGRAEGGAADDDVLIPPPRNPARMPKAVEDTAKAMTIDPISDAYSAIRGRMTPDEQQNFAMSAAMGLVSPMRGIRPRLSGKVVTADSYLQQMAKKYGAETDMVHWTEPERNQYFGLVDKTQPKELPLIEQDKTAVATNINNAKGLADYANKRGLSDGAVKGLIDELYSSPKYRTKTFQEYIAAKGQQMKQAGFAAGGPPKMSISPPYYARAEARGLGHTGPILSAVGGRTDHHAMSVPAKSYVLPADHVSSLGQGNSLNGLAVLNKMFPIKHGAGPPRPPQMGRIRAAGGATGGEGPVPIYAAGGEFVISPEHVAELGGGDHAQGHRILDSWVKSNRKKLIKTLSNLPGPAKD